MSHVWHTLSCSSSCREALSLRSGLLPSGACSLTRSSFACLADNGTTLWSINFGPSVQSADLVPPCPELGQEIGILSTPVIDPTTNTIYLMPFIVENGAQSYR